jgi:signal transduction histidine kinase
LEVSSITCDKQDIKTYNKLREAIELARGGLKDIQRSISGLGPEKLEDESFIAAINKLVAEFKNSGAEIELTVHGIEKPLNYARSEALYRVCQESMTNSIRHGKATRIEIIIKFSENKVKLFIVDNGVGCENIKKGFGLLGMEQRLYSVGGTLYYGSGGEKGFNISAEVPLYNEA